jgi:hypothetical protein
MEMINVYSSAIRAVGYDPASQRMRIAFVDGHSYDFCRVPSNIFDRLLHSSSKGGYYNQYIKDRYPC